MPATSKSHETGGTSFGAIFHVYISEFALDEVSAGDPAAARQRLKILNSLPLLDITPEVAELASGFLNSGKIPRKAATDAAHIAIAAVRRSVCPQRITSAIFRHGAAVGRQVSDRATSRSCGLPTWPEMKRHYCCTVISVPPCVVRPLYIAIVGWSPLASEGGTTTLN